MATRTAVIQIGVGHPNYGGFVDPPGVTSLWLSEGARPIWLQFGNRTFQTRRGWLPRDPATILIDGMAAVLLAQLVDEDLECLPPAVRECLRGRKVDFHNCDTNVYEKLIDVAQEQAVNFSGKLIISTFSGSAILQMWDTVDAFDIDVELLAPFGTRLWNRWRSETIRTGFLAK